MRFSVGVVLAGMLFSGCASGGGHVGPSGDDDTQTPDAPKGGPDAPVNTDPDAPDMHDAAPTADAALLLTEVVLAPTGGEFVEITNPTSGTVDLSTYYLSDSGLYWKLPGGAPTLDANDFIAKFPDGQSLAPGATIVVAIDTATNFMTTYGTAPTYSVAGATMTVVANNGVATLTNGGEPIILFQWSGQASDLVRDVDIVLAGVPSSANLLVDKSNQTVGSATYKADARTIAAQPTAPASGKSTKRVKLPTGHETAAGTGNGIDGSDQTTEDEATTWDTAFTAPTPGLLPAGGLAP